MPSLHDAFLAFMPRRLMTCSSTLDGIIISLALYMPIARVIKLLAGLTADGFRHARVYTSLLFDATPLAREPARVIIAMGGLITGHAARRWSRMLRNGQLADAFSLFFISLARQVLRTI